MKSKNSKILITGGGGYLGKALTKLVLTTTNNDVIIYSRDELKHHEIQIEFREYHSRIKNILGDIRDHERLKSIENIDTIFHCAALKHVKFSLTNEIEFIKTNIEGTENLLKLCQEKEVKSFTFFSTDKAVNPSNHYGVTKKAGEELVKLYSKINHCTNFRIIRFGNLLGSTGSLIPSLLFSIQNKNTPQISSLNITRFTCTAEEIASLAMSTLSINNAVIIPKLKAFVMRDILAAMHINSFDLRGEGPGEKKHEELFSIQEEQMLNINTDYLYYYFDSLQDPSLQDLGIYRNSSLAPKISTSELSAIINQILRYAKM